MGSHTTRHDGGSSIFSLNTGGVADASDLQYLNGKAAYIDSIWKVINWKTAESRFQGGRDDAFKDLRASM